LRAFGVFFGFVCWGSPEKTKQLFIENHFWTHTPQLPPGGWAARRLGRWTARRDPHANSHVPFEAKLWALRPLAVFASARKEHCTLAARIGRGKFQEQRHGGSTALVAAR
jgi:hypothetical protein